MCSIFLINTRPGRDVDGLSGWRLGWGQRWMDILRWGDSAVRLVPGVVVSVSSRVRSCNTLSSGSHGGLVIVASWKGDPYM